MEQRPLMVTPYWSGWTLSDALVMLLAVDRVETRRGVLSVGPTPTVESSVLAWKSTSTMISQNRGNILTLQSFQWPPPLQLHPWYTVHRLLRPLAPQLFLDQHRTHPHVQRSVEGCRHDVCAAVVHHFLRVTLHFLHLSHYQQLHQGEVVLCTH